MVEETRDLVESQMQNENVYQRLRKVGCLYARESNDQKKERKGQRQDKQPK